MLAHCVTSGRGLNLWALWFPHLSEGDDNPCSGC